MISSDDDPYDKYIDARDFIENKYQSLPPEIDVLYFEIDETLDIRYINHIIINKLILGGSFANDALKYLSKNNINEIIIQGNNITNRNLKYLSEYDIIEIVGANITDNGFKYLTNVNKLKLSHCNLVTSKGLSYLFNLKTLIINTCPKIDSTFGLYIPNVESVDLIHFETLKNHDLKYLTGIKQIGLPRTFILSDAGAKFISNVSQINFHCNYIMNVHALRHLQVSHITLIDTHFCHILISLPDIKCIDWKYSQNDDINQLIQKSNTDLIN